MASHPAIRLAAKPTKSAIGYIHLQCHDLRLRSPKDGEANLSVRKVFSDIFKCRKSDVEIARGLKSREKMVIISGIDIQRDEDKCISRIREQLESAIE